MIKNNGNNTAIFTACYNLEIPGKCLNAECGHGLPPMWNLHTWTWEIYPASDPADSTGRTVKEPPARTARETPV